MVTSLKINYHKSYAYVFGTENAARVRIANMLGWNRFTDAQQKRRNDVDTGLSLYRYMDSISRNIYGL
jgi:hypothetical protein